MPRHIAVNQENSFCKFTKIDIHLMFTEFFQLFHMTFNTPKAEPGLSLTVIFIILKIMNKWKNIVMQVQHVATVETHHASNRWCFSYCKVTREDVTFLMNLHKLCSATEWCPRESWKHRLFILEPPNKWNCQV